MQQACKMSTQLAAAGEFSARSPAVADCCISRPQMESPFVQLLPTSSTQQHVTYTC